MDERASSKNGTLNVTTRGARRASLGNTVAAVFLTTELLEQVLYCMPAKEVLLAQRVCRKFRCVISESKLLQQKLFFSPAEMTSGWKYDALAGNWIRLSGTDLGAAQRQGSDIVSDGVPNPMLFQQAGEPDPPRLHAGRRRHIGLVATYKDLGPSMHHPQASWRRMYLTQPPRDRANLLLSSGHDGSAYRKDGVKGSDLYQTRFALEKQLNRAHNRAPGGVKLHVLLL